MKELSVPFSLFDFFAVLFPGAVCLFGVYLFINPSLTKTGHEAIFSETILQRPPSDLLFMTVLVLASFMLGQVLVSLSEILIDIPWDKFIVAHVDLDITHDNVQKAIEKIFGQNILQQDDVRHTFIMVESTVGAYFPDAAATAKRFIALAVMFRSLALALLFVGAALIRGFTIGQTFLCSFPIVMPVMIFLFIVITILLWSYRHYKGMWSRTIYMSFVAWSRLQ